MNFFEWKEIKNKLPYLLKKTLRINFESRNWAGRMRNNGCWLFWVDFNSIEHFWVSKMESYLLFSLFSRWLFSFLYILFLFTCLAFSLDLTFPYSSQLFSQASGQIWCFFYIISYSPKFLERGFTPFANLLPLLRASLRSLSESVEKRLLSQVPF